MPKLYQSVKTDIQDAAKSLPKSEREKYIKKAEWIALKNKNNRLPSS